MSWILRPYFNSGAVIRPVGGNLYIDVGAFVLSVSRGPILLIEALVVLGLIIWTSSLASKLMRTLQLHWRGLIAGTVEKSWHPSTSSAHIVEPQGALTEDREKVDPPGFVR